MERTHKENDVDVVWNKVKRIFQSGTEICRITPMGSDVWWDEKLRNQVHGEENVYKRTVVAKNEDTSRHKAVNNGYMVPKNVKESKKPLKIKNKGRDNAEQY